MKMKCKKRSCLVLILCVICLLVSSCMEPGSGNLPDGKTLAVPAVTVSETGLATWKAVEHAGGYAYIIDDGSEMRTSECRVQLTTGQSVRVKALPPSSNPDGYRESAYSAAVSFTAFTPVITGCVHTDADSNGFCDLCNIKTVAVLDFYAINDLHGKFEDTDSQPGVDELTTYIKNQYADPAQYEILLSSGDMWQGSVESSTNRGALMTEWMNELDFVSMTLGNHEYDWGADVISDNAELAEFPFLAINVTYQGQAVDYCRPSVIVERGGVKIGIIGAIGNCLSSISGEFTDGLSFATGEALTAMVKAEAIRLKNEEGCNLVVYSIHDGYDSGTSSVQNMNASGFTDGNGRIYYDTALSNGYIDLVFEGHTHQSYILRDEFGVYHLQAGGENRALSYVTLTYDLVGRSYTINAQRLANSVYGNASIADDPFTDQLFQKYFPDDNPYVTVLGNSATAKDSDAIADQVAELYLQAGMELWGDDYEIVLGGGFLRTRTPYDLHAGNITYADLFSLLPFDNALVLGSISGYKLRTQFLESRNSSYHCAVSPDFSGTVDNDRTYYIVVDSYTSTYAPNGITEVARLNEKIYARDLLKEFILSGGWDVQSGGAVSVAEAIRIGDALALGGETSEWYTVTGTVAEIADNFYGNLYLTDGTNRIYVYGLYSADGTTLYGNLTEKPKVGDRITVFAPVKKFYSAYDSSVTVELYRARLMESQASASTATLYLWMPVAYLIGDGKTLIL